MLLFFDINTYKSSDGRVSKNEHNFFLFDEITNHENLPFISKIMSHFNLQINFLNDRETGICLKWSHVPPNVFFMDQCWIIIATRNIRTHKRLENIIKYPVCLFSIFILFHVTLLPTNEKLKSFNFSKIMKICSFTNILAI